MATIKSFTSLEQSKKLAEILPLESADMYYLAKPDDTNSNMVASNICIPRRSENDGQAFGEACAWSLAALLNVMPKEIVYKEKIVFLEFHIWENSLEYANAGGYTLCATESYDNHVDACVDMILKLNELNLL